MTNSIALILNPKLYFEEGNKWSKTELTWKLQNYTLDLGLKKTRFESFVFLILILKLTSI
jgi:hypothetical protein